MIKKKSAILEENKKRHLTLFEEKITRLIIINLTSLVKIFLIFNLRPISKM